MPVDRLPVKTTARAIADIPQPRIGKMVGKHQGAIANQFAKVTFYADNRPFLPQVSVPSLILQCTDDIFAAPEIGAYMHQHLSQSTLKNLEAIGHFPHISNPSEFIIVLKEYLDDVTPSR
ncbi:MAG: alpha/beta hydrolase [Alkalinema sp. RU_4_3]|nr:alpha/beta hydrolase [Alkalinema sp. RU_4_3]